MLAEGDHVHTTTLLHFPDLPAKISELAGEVAAQRHTEAARLGQLLPHPRVSCRVCSWLATVAASIKA